MSDVDEDVRAVHAIAVLGRLTVEGGVTGAEGLRRVVGTRHGRYAALVGVVSQAGLKGLRFFDDLADLRVAPPHGALALPPQLHAPHDGLSYRKPLLEPKTLKVC